MITVFLVDDHEVVRRGVADLLDAESDLTVIGEAGTVAEAGGRIAATLPDVALLDVRLPDGSGVDLCRDLQSIAPSVRCIMLTAYDDEQALMSAVIAGASGYALKDIRGAALVESVRRVASGRSLLNPGLVKRVQERLMTPKPEDPHFATLTLRERQILSLIADGLTNRQIADRLSLSEKTVKNYVSALLRKLGLERRTQAVIFQLGIRAPEDR
jgi:two-component system response regulator DevR